MADSVGGAAEAVDDAIIDRLGLRDAVNGALREARASGLTRAAPSQYRPSSAIATKPLGRWRAPNGKGPSPSVGA
jgi:hypothetical protein